MSPLMNFLICHSAHEWLLSYCFSLKNNLHFIAREKRKKIIIEPTYQLRNFLKTKKKKFVFEM